MIMITIMMIIIRIRIRIHSYLEKKKWVKMMKYAETIFSHIFRLFCIVNIVCKRLPMQIIWYISM